MRSRALSWTLAGVVTLAVAAAVVIALDGDGADAPPESAAAVTATTVASLAETPPASESTSPSTSSPVATQTTGSSAPTTTSTTLPAPPTTLPAPITDASGYAAVPKPSAGPNTVAPGGALTKHLAADIAASFGFSTAEVEVAIAAAELPPEAGGNPEGWLAPGQYPPATSVQQAVQAMVDRRVQQLETRGVPRPQWHRVLTAASVIEKETYNQTEKPNVARVLNNRLAGGGPLQMDSIILYPVPEDRIFTTSAERDANQPYNSYRHDGLPPTPICSPDEASLDAFLTPPPGDWWFYVTIDLHSGETRYAVTYEEHQANVELLRTWLRENPTD